MAGSHGRRRTRRRGSPWRRRGSHHGDGWGGRVRWTAWADESRRRRAQRRVGVEDTLGIGPDGGTDVERYARVLCPGSGGGRAVFDAHVVAVRTKPREEVLGERLVDGAAKNYPRVAGVVAGDVTGPIDVQNPRWDRGRQRQWGRRRRGHTGRGGQRKRPLTVGAELARGHGSSGAEDAHDLTTNGLILYETTSQRAGTRGRRGLLTTVRPTPPIPARAEKEKNL